MKLFLAITLLVGTASAAKPLARFQALRAGAGSDAALVRWTEHKNTNIGGHANYKACDEKIAPPNEDVRTNPAKVAACKSICDKDAQCKAIVFHKWGVMMKKAVGAMDKEGKSGADFLTFTKMTPFKA